MCISIRNDKRKIEKGTAKYHGSSRLPNCNERKAMLLYMYIMVRKARALLMIRKITALLTAVFLLSLSGCGKTPEPATTPAAEAAALSTTPPQTTPTERPTETSPELPESETVFVSFMPTETAAWCHVALPDQEAAVAAFEQATAAVYSDEWWIKGDKTVGLDVEYKGEIWSFVDSGELVWPLGRVKAEDAAPLYALCQAAAREAGWKDAVTPEQLRSLSSATLRSGEREIPLTDPSALARLEQILTAGKFSLGGTGCPFGALLDLETANGDTLTIALATDSCGVWMSEGCYYDYGSDSGILFDLFGVQLEFGKIQ